MNLMFIFDFIGHSDSIGFIMHDIILTNAFHIPYVNSVRHFCLVFFFSFFVLFRELT